MSKKDKDSPSQENQKIECETPFGQDYFWKELEIIVMDGAEVEIVNDKQS